MHLFHLEAAENHCPKHCIFLKNNPEHRIEKTTRCSTFWPVGGPSIFRTIHNIQITCSFHPIHQHDMIHLMPLVPKDRQVENKDLPTTRWSWVPPPRALSFWPMWEGKSKKGFVESVMENSDLCFIQLNRRMWYWNRRIGSQSDFS